MGAGRRGGPLGLRHSCYKWPSVAMRQQYLIRGGAGGPRVALQLLFELSGLGACQPTSGDQLAPGI